MPETDWHNDMLLLWWAQDWEAVECCLAGGGKISEIERDALLQVLASSRKSPESAVSRPLPLLREGVINRTGSWTIKSNATDHDLRISGNVPENVDTVYLFHDELLLKAINTEPQGPGTRSFRFKLRTWLARNLREGAKLALTCDGGLIPYRQEADCHTVTSGAPDDRLRRRMLEGAIVSKKGMIHRPVTTDPEWRHKALEAYSQTRHYFSRTFGYDVWVAYGTLLGLWRDGDLIPYDDDFDAIYVSQSDTPEAMAEERRRILNRMRADGLPAKIGESGVLKVGERKLLDLAPGYWHGGCLVVQAFTIQDISPEQIEPLRKMQFEGTELLLPNDPTAFLAREYGENWDTPDPAFVTKRPEDPENLLVRGKATNEDVRRFG